MKYACNSKATDNREAIKIVLGSFYKWGFPNILLGEGFLHSPLIRSKIPLICTQSAKNDSLFLRNKFIFKNKILFML